jgi:hypothetical protein
MRCPVLFSIYAAYGPRCYLPLRLKIIRHIILFCTMLLNHPQHCKLYNQNHQKFILMYSPNIVLSFPVCYVYIYVAPIYHNLFSEVELITLQSTSLSPTGKTSCSFNDKAPE